MPRILLIEDDPLMRDSVKAILDERLYQIVEANEGLEGSRRAVNEHYDLILLDLMLPGKSGFLIARQIRDAHIETPVLMMSTKQAISDVITGFQCGADGYLYKPFNLLELRCRVEALLKRPPHTIRKNFRWHGLHINCETMLITRGNHILQLPGKEFKLLEYFFNHPGKTLSKGELISAVWDYQDSTFANTLDVHISKIRRHFKKKLELDDCPIKTVHGRGFRLDLE